MTVIQTPDEIRDILKRLEGETFGTLQVLGINSLKSLSPKPDDLVGETITGATVTDRVLEIRTKTTKISIDLQRTGRLVWLSAAERHDLTAGAARPTVRLILASGVGLDLTEPARTKRITVTLSAV